MKLSEIDKAEIAEAFKHLETTKAAIENMLFYMRYLNGWKSGSAIILDDVVPIIEHLHKDVAVKWRGWNEKRREMLFSKPVKKRKKAAA